MPTYPILVAVLTAALLAGPAPAQDDAAKKELDDLKRSQAELRRLVEEQQKRIEELERRQAPAAPPPSAAAPPPPAAGPPPAPGAVEDRLKKLEEQSAKQGLDRPETLRAYWKEGFFLETADKAFKMQIGGRILLDAAWISEDEDLEQTAGVGHQEDGFAFRSTRLFVGGTLYERVEFKAEYDFANGAASAAEFRDVYIGVVKLPVVGNFRVGHWREPFSLEQLTSNKYISFMERSLADAFVPARNTGAMFYDAPFGERMTWAAGVFRDSDNYGRGTGDGAYAFTGRLTGLPWYEEEGRKLWHLGAAVTLRNPDDDLLRFRQRPESNLASRFVDTGSFDAEQLNLFGAETALVWGPFSVQGEWMPAVVESDVNGDPVFHGWYAFASWFVTGENRNFRKSGAHFDRIRPKANFLDGKGGGGAWELTGRVSSLSLIDEAIDGRRMLDLTAGVNWYLNPMTRIMLNYIRSEVDRRGGDVGGANIFAMRFQVEF